jgi:hypothetical protein
MKELVLFLLSITGFLLFACAPEQATKAYKCGLIDSSTIILSAVFPDTEKNIENDLIIFALIQNGEFKPIDDYNARSNIEVKERDSILKEVKSYYCCNNGSQVNIQIDSIVSSAYDCDDLRAGKFGLKLKLQNNLIASNFKVPCNDQFERINKNSKDSLFYKITTDSLFSPLNAHYANIDFDIIRLKDSHDILCFANAADSLKAISNLYFLDLSNNSVLLIDLISDELEIDSWGSGYEFFDYRDIDGDTTPELFIYNHGYEWTTILVYKKSGGKYVKKLENMIFGC